MKNKIWGVVLVVLGILIGLKLTGIMDFNIFFEGWWTLFIIIPSLVGFLTEKEKTGNLIGIIIGVVLLLCSQHILSYEKVWKLAVPAILVIIGLSFIFKDTFNKKVSEEIKELNKNRSNKNEHCATFSGTTVNFDSEKFTGTDLTAIFGGIECNLKRAIIEEDVVINVNSIFGGIDIYVPNDVKVKVKSSAIFGGVSDERKSKEESEDSKTVYINATCVFGGVEIK